MKTKLILIAFLGAFLAFPSCQKDSSTTATNPAPATYPIEGLWIGTYTVENVPSQSGVYYYSYAVYPDGSILVKGLGADGNTYYSTGNWTLSSTNVFSATFISINFNGAQVTQVITANFSNTGIMTDGVRTDTINGSETANLSTMQRVN